MRRLVEWQRLYKVTRPLLATDATTILSKNHIQRPIQSIFNLPVGANIASKVGGINSQRTEKKAGLTSSLHKWHWERITTTDVSPDQLWPTEASRWCPLSTKWQWSTIHSSGQSCYSKSSNQAPARVCRCFKLGGVSMASQPSARVKTANRAITARSKSWWAQRPCTLGFSRSPQWVRTQEDRQKESDMELHG